MPHLMLQYSSSLEGFQAAEALLALNATLVDTGRFHAVDIKSRALACETVCIGLGSPQDAFVHVDLRVMEGRENAFLRRLPMRLLGVLGEQLPPAHRGTVHCSVELSELYEGLYAKRLHRPGILQGIPRGLWR